MPKEVIVKFEEIARKGLDTMGQLTEKVNETFYVTGVDIREMGNLGECAIVTIEDEKGNVEKRHTFSKVLVDQLKQIKETIESGEADKVEVTLRKRKRYYTFE